MKMTTQDYERLEKAIIKSLRSHPRLLADITTTRGRWDLMWASGLEISSRGLDLYSYLTDTQIDTGLRRIVESLKKEEQKP